MSKNQQQAIELFINGDEKHTRTVDIITRLLEGEEPIDIAQSYGISRQSVTNIRAKYIKQVEPT